jgi:hypothetical protein
VARVLLAWVFEGTSSMVRRILVVLLVPASFGCASTDPNVVREKFVAEHSCPAEKVEVTPRADLALAYVGGGRIFLDQWMAGAAPREPADVAADPERDRVWHETQRAEWRRYADDYDSLSSRIQRSKLESNLERIGLFQARGCGADVLLACYLSSLRDGERTAHMPTGRAGGRVETRARRHGPPVASAGTERARDRRKADAQLAFS